MKIASKAVTPILVLILFFMLVFLLLVGSVKTANAEVVLPEGVSVNEKNIAINNLNYKLESDEVTGDLIEIKLLYDFNQEPLYSLYEFENYYMICIRSTSTILERGEGNSLYYGITGKLYYGDFFQAYKETNNNIVNIVTGEVLSQQKITEKINHMQEIREMDYQDYINRDTIIETRGESNRNRITKLGNSDTKYNYFAQEINPKYQVVNSSSLPINDLRTISKMTVLYTQNMFSPRNYGTVYARNFTFEYDLLYPQNVYNECSLVTMVMLLQYYDRLGLNTSLIPQSINYAGDINNIINNPLYSKSEKVKFKLMPYLSVLDGIGESMDGAATYVNIDAAFDDYFDDNNINCSSTHFTSYTNIKGAIDDGNPSIITVGAGRGFTKNKDGNYVSVDLSGHNVVAYGYTKNALGIMDEFICHANWHTYDSSNGNDYAVVYMNKLYCAGNLHLNVL